MLVNATEMLKKAKAGHYAVGQFNINNLEWTKAILQTAQELNSPVILGVSEGAGKYMTGYKTVVGMVNGMMEELNITVPVALHLDHGSYDGCLKCVEAGFSSIMFDGSHYPIDENVAKTKELVKIVAEHKCLLRQRLVPSVARKMVLLVWASALILRSARELQISESTSLQLVSVTFTENIRLTGRA
jgi:fructose-bisphosphate aldolase class II